MSDTGSASGTMNCSFNGSPLSPKATWPGYGYVSLEGMHSPKVMHVLLGELHTLFLTIKISINNLESESANSLSQAMGLAGPCNRSDFLIRHSSVLGDPQIQRIDY